MCHRPKFEILVVRSGAHQKIEGENDYGSRHCNHN
jgi:hypothetical protein